MSFILKFNAAVSDDQIDTVVGFVTYYIDENQECGLRAVLAKDLYLIADTKEDMKKLLSDIFDADVMVDNVGFVETQPEIDLDADFEEVEFIVYYFETVTKKALLEALSA